MLECCALQVDGQYAVSTELLEKIMAIIGPYNKDQNGISKNVLYGTKCHRNASGPVYYCPSVS